MTLYKDIMPYFDKFIRLLLKSVYIVIPLKNLDTQKCFKCQFWAPIRLFSKTWLRPCIRLHFSSIILQGHPTVALSYRHGTKEAKWAKLNANSSIKLSKFSQRMASQALKIFPLFINLISISNHFDTDIIKPVNIILVIYH